MSLFIKNLNSITGSKPLKLAWLSFLYIVPSVFDVFGIGLLVPFLYLLVNSEKIPQYHFWQVFHAHFVTITPHTALFVLGLAVVAWFIVKNVLSYIIQDYVFSYCYSVFQSLTLKLLNFYQHQNYNQRLNRNTSDLVNRLTQDTGYFVSNSIVPFFQVIANAVMAIGLLMLLLFSNFLITISLFVLFAGFLIIYDKLIRRKMSRYGEIISNSNANFIKTINHAMHGIVEITLIGCQKYFFKKAVNDVTAYSEVGAKSLAMQFVPKLMIESVLVTFIVVLALSAYMAAGTGQVVMKNIILLGAISVRLMPVITQLGINFIRLRQSDYVLSVLVAEVENSERVSNVIADVQQPVTSFDTFENIQLQNVFYKYDAANKNVLTDISLVVDAGSITSIVGKTGAGKSTLINILMGFLSPTQGKIVVNSVVVDTQEKIQAWQKCIAYIPQATFILDDSIIKNVALGVDDSLIDLERVKKSLADAQLTDFIAQLPEGLNTVVGEAGARLSGGQRQRIAIARALYFQRKVLIMDEPTSSLDKDTEQQIMSVLSSLRGLVTIIIVTHRLSLLNISDCVYRMANGELVEEGITHDAH